MNLLGKRIAILIENLYQDMEAYYPYYRLKEAGATVFFVGPEKGVAYKSKHGYEAESELSITEVSSEEYDAVIIPGGFAPDYMRRNKEMVAFVKDMAQKEKVVAAICHAGWMLVSADVIRAKRVTAFYAIKDDMKNAGGDWEYAPVVRDGNIITSRTPDDLPMFLKTIIDALNE
ncbi:MAG: type 1 glutamine amidotransferase [Candidatus Jacksonbacteria bacterium]|jgi:protease I|nr:type 1 glutamine amidotransferase [Candidatus Jacksonbacteria bacterium]MBT6034794.1 type 1 glutamine amidotransferase [Candidatus Jacksonbacteria bacterium]MBT6301652.1 type 1 glutamine amidotransferase [Candidatus Jacksonbacteria bacterium]MBT6757459.1 type 1 glutamine amidotransferase [Candidatus Jacksonbacteria bacterium]MBT6955209.1 type 1 glutamine amidotransferase [Candidatus Jacksonbacteria bacterium]